MSESKSKKVFRRRGNPYTVSGLMIYYSHYGKQNGDFSKKLKIESPYDPAILLLGMDPKEVDSMSKSYLTLLFITALLRGGEVSTGDYPLTNKENATNTRWDTTQRYKHEILWCIMTQMNVKDVMLSEISPTQKNKYNIAFLWCGI